LTTLLGDDQPRLAVPDGHFDLIYAFSVFTHLSEHWAGWMLELHRVLADGGLLFATFLGTDFAPILCGEEWDEDETGMTVIGAGTPWTDGGPCTIVSEWWLRAHWNRAFEILVLSPSSAHAQGAVLMRRRPVQLTPDDLERSEPGEPRELSALAAGRLAVMRDDRRRREGLEWRLNTAATRIRELEQELALRPDQLAVVYGSKSWRLTAPLRALVSGRRARS